MSDKRVYWLLVDDNARGGSERHLPLDLDAEPFCLQHLDPAVLYGEEAIRRAVADQPDVVLLDLRIAMVYRGEKDRRHGVATAVAIRQRTAGKTQVLMYSGNLPNPGSRTERELIKQLATVGVLGYLEKDTSFDRLAQAIAEAADGIPVFIPGEAHAKWLQCLQPWPHKCFDMPEPLTPEEHKTMVLYALTGWLAKEIASYESLHVKSISRRTIHSYLQDSYDKIGLPSGQGRGIALGIWARANCPVVQDQLALLEANPSDTDRILKHVLLNDRLHSPSNGEEAS